MDLLNRRPNPSAESMLLSAAATEASVSEARVGAGVTASFDIGLALKLKLSYDWHRRLCNDEATASPPLTTFDLPLLLILGGATGSSSDGVVAALRRQYWRDNPYLAEGAGGFW